MRDGNGRVCGFVPHAVNVWRKILEMFAPPSPFLLLPNWRLRVRADGASGVVMATSPYGFFLAVSARIFINRSTSAPSSTRPITSLGSLRTAAGAISKVWAVSPSSSWNPAIAA